LKKILIPILALLLLAGGGAGAYFFMGKADAAAGPEAVKEAKKEGKAEGEKTIYVPMQAIILPIIGRDGISQTISMVVSLQVSDQAKADKVKEALPRLADAFLSDMYGNLSSQSAMQGGVIKVSVLKERLAEITKKVMGEDMVQGVLLQVLQQHPT
jgi:flagellar FliL protein